jgi:excisionase family DNA binding protein
MSVHIEPQDSAPRLLSRDDVAECLGASVSTVLRLERRGELPHIKLGRLVRFKPTDVEALIERAYTAPENDVAPAGGERDGKTPEATRLHGS